jgi:hypothetical protein
VAPLSGRISNRRVDPGNLVKADDTMLATIVSLDPIYVYFDVNERTVLRLRRLIQEGRIGSTDDSKIEVQVSLADEDDFEHRGIINFFDNQIDPNTGTQRVRAAIDNADRLLSPGLFIRLRFPVGAPHKALLVQEESLSTDQGQRFLYVINDKDEVVYRRVKVGLLVNGRRVIEEGLQPGERVVLSGLQRIRPGDKVTVKPMASSGAPASPATGLALVSAQQPLTVEETLGSPQPKHAPALATSPASGASNVQTAGNVQNTGERPAKAETRTSVEKPIFEDPPAATEAMPRQHAVER